MFKLIGGFASLLGLLFASLVVTLTTGTPQTVALWLGIGFVVIGGAYFGAFALDLASACRTPRSGSPARLAARPPARRRAAVR
jgi:hypothetical protein